MSSRPGHLIEVFPDIKRLRRKAVRGPDFDPHVMIGVQTGILPVIVFLRRRFWGLNYGRFRWFLHGSGNLRLSARRRLFDGQVLDKSHGSIWIRYERHQISVSLILPPRIEISIFSISVLLGFRFIFANNLAIRKKYSRCSPARPVPYMFTMAGLIR